MLRSLSTKLFQTNLKTSVITQVRECRAIHEDFMTAENKKFVTDVLNDRFDLFNRTQIDDSLIKTETIEQTEFKKRDRRCGLIARKIGVVPIWRKDGTKISTTMLQIDDNHVIKYMDPNEFSPAQKPRVENLKKFGCVLVGAGSADPTLFTKEYCGLFKDSGVMPKKYLGRFLVTPNAKISPGTFRVGDFVDVRGKTVDRGFQGVMKRWGFKGMPATHGVTKTHRRPGNIGSGGNKARVRPGQKMPGHMGNRYRIIKGLEIVRINTEYNVMWVTGHNIPGELNNIIYIYDTILPLKRPKITPPVPTSFEELKKFDKFADKYHTFSSPTIFYEED